MHYRTIVFIFSWIILSLVNFHIVHLREESTMTADNDILVYVVDDLALIDAINWAVSGAR